MAFVRDFADVLLVGRETGRCRNIHVGNKINRSFHIVSIREAETPVEEGQVEAHVGDLGFFPLEVRVPHSGHVDADARGIDEIAVHGVNRLGRLGREVRFTGNAVRTANF